MSKIITIYGGDNQKMNAKITHLKSSEIVVHFKGGYFIFTFDGHIKEFTKEMFIDALIHDIWAIRFWQDSNEFDLLAISNGNYRRINSIIISLSMKFGLNNFIPLLSCLICIAS